MNPSAETQLVLKLINLNSTLQRRLTSALSVHGIGVSEFLVLKQLAEATNLKMRRVDLADCIGLTASGVTRLLNPMEKIGLVEKDSSARDARVSLVALSSAGQQMLRDIETTVNAASETLLKALNKQQQQDLCEIIEQF